MRNCNFFIYIFILLLSFICLMIKAKKFEYFIIIQKDCIDVFCNNREQNEEELILDILWNKNTCWYHKLEIGILLYNQTRRQASVTEAAVADMKVIYNRHSDRLVPLVVGHSQLPLCGCFKFIHSFNHSPLLKRVSKRLPIQIADWKLSRHFWKIFLVLDILQLSIPYNLVIILPEVQSLILLATITRRARTHYMP